MALQCVSAVWWFLYIEWSAIETPRGLTSFSIQTVSFVCSLRKDSTIFLWSSTQSLHLWGGHMRESNSKARSAEYRLWELGRQWSKGYATVVVLFGLGRSSFSGMKIHVNPSSSMTSFLKTFQRGGFYYWIQCLQQVRAIRLFKGFFLHCRYRRISYDGRGSIEIPKCAWREDIVPESDSQSRGRRIFRRTLSQAACCHSLCWSGLRWEEVWAVTNLFSRMANGRLSYIVPGLGDFGDRFYTIWIATRHAEIHM